MDPNSHAAGTHGADPQAQAREAMESVLARSATDREFRNLLLTSPREALSLHFGRPVPEDFNVRFVENMGVATLVLPDLAPGCGPGAEALPLTQGTSMALRGGPPHPSRALD